jgi:heat shock protein HtpX
MNEGNAILFTGLALVFTIGSCYFSYYNSDKLVLKMAHARPVDKLKEPYLFNTIEGVAMAANVPVPAMYVIETDLLNAFATGRDPQHSAICVTRGLLEALNREELEGVIAHEMSHIKNYDVLLSTIIVVLAGTLVFLSRIFMRASFFGGSKSKSNNKDNSGAGAIVAIVGLILMILAPIFATLVQLSLSRNREYLADASAAQILGYPLGLASALKKLQQASDPKKAQKQDFANSANAGLFIINPLEKNLNASSMFSTHPPLAERIKRLEAM